MNGLGAARHRRQGVMPHRRAAEPLKKHVSAAFARVREVFHELLL